MEEQAKLRPLKDSLPVHRLPIKWTANAKLKEVVSKFAELPNTRQVSLTCINDQTSEFHLLIDIGYKVVPTRQHIFEIQKKLEWEEFVAATEYL